MNRRRFLGAAFLPKLLPAAGYDLVIRKGRVIDPSQHLDRITDVQFITGELPRWAATCKLPNPSTPQASSSYPA